MVYVLHLYEVDEETRAEFESAFDDGGFVYHLLSSVPGHLHTHLMRREGASSIYLSITFWIKAEDYARFRTSLEKVVFEHWIELSPLSFSHIGAFHFRNHGDNSAGQAAA